MATPFQHYDNRHIPQLRRSETKAKKEAKAMKSIR